MKKKRRVLPSQVGIEWTATRGILLGGKEPAIQACLGLLSRAKLRKVLRDRTIAKRSKGLAWAEYLRRARPRSA